MVFGHYGCRHHMSSLDSVPSGSVFSPKNSAVSLGSRRKHSTPNLVDLFGQLNKCATLWGLLLHSGH